jgi:hypothetical protein
VPAGAPTVETGHLDDRVVAVRFDANRDLEFNLDGHFMDGVGVPNVYPGGFYLLNNPNGLNNTTNAVVVKTNFNF